MTDHAIVRYLERQKGVDVEAIRNEIRKIADESTPVSDGEHHWHESGAMLVIAESGRVVTVLSPEQVEKWGGRKLKGGKRIGQSDDGEPA